MRLLTWRFLAAAVGVGVVWLLVVSLVLASRSSSSSASGATSALATPPVPQTTSPSSQASAATDGGGGRGGGGGAAPLPAATEAPKPPDLSTLEPRCFTDDLESTLPGKDIAECLALQPTATVPETRMAADGETPAPSPTGARYAYVFHAVKTPWTLGAWTIIKALVAGDTQADVVLLVTGDQWQMPTELLAALQAFGPRVRFWRAVSIPGSNIGRYAESFTKLRAWQLVEYDAVMFLDSDVLPRRNLDELFAVGAKHGFAAPPDSFELFQAPLQNHVKFNTGLFVLRPDKKRFQQLETDLRNPAFRRVQDFADMDFLNAVFDDYHQLHPASVVWMSTLCAWLFPFDKLMEPTSNLGGIHFNWIKPFSHRSGVIAPRLYSWWWTVSETPLARLAAMPSLGLTPFCD